LNDKYFHGNHSLSKIPHIKKESPVKVPPSSDTLLIIPCTDDTYLGRLIRECTIELVDEGKAFSPESCNLDDADAKQNINRLMAQADRCIAVDCCETGHLSKQLTDLHCEPEFKLVLTDLGIDDLGDSPCLDEDIDLVKDAIIAFSTRLSDRVPRLPGCCC
jgi:uncharacterized metal-binding protein